MIRAMSKHEVDAYLAALDEPKRSSLQTVRERILSAAPGAEECISYGMPAFRVDGRVICGFAAFKSHLAYMPHSGSVFNAIADELAGYTFTPGSLHFPVDQPLPAALVKRLIAVRRDQLAHKAVKPRRP
jgi:uncharacterized protein YdhG (YjbR/CyaY superfamily)